MTQIPVRNNQLTLVGNFSIDELEPKAKNRQILGPGKKTKKKAAEHKDDSDTNCSWYTQNNPQSMERRLKELEIRGRIKTI